MARILIVDDSLVMRRNLKTILTRAGHSVVAEAETGREAIKKFERYQPDLVTMDITMPGMDGVDTLKELKILYPYANIIMVSSVNSKTTILAALRGGARHYIIKPFCEEDVLRVVDEVLTMIGREQVSVKFLNERGGNLDE